MEPLETNDQSPLYVAETLRGKTTSEWAEVEKVGSDEDNDTDDSGRGEDLE